MNIEQIDTPIVVIDVDVMRRNIERLQAHCDVAGLRNRPHVKTHKIPELARLQMSMGAVGVTCQKLGEAEVMAVGGVEDILIAYNLIGGFKPDRAVGLARQVALTLCCDNDVVAQGLSDAFVRGGMRADMLVECDTGAQRCGMATPAAAVALAERIDGMAGLRFSGFLTYPPAGHERQVRAFMAEALDACERRGLDARIVSSGGTPGAWRSARDGGITEYRAGTYIYNDRMMMEAGVASLEDCALTVHATVVSRPAEDRAIIDAGSKSFGADSLGPEAGFGTILEYPEAWLARLNEEHGIVDLSRCMRKPGVGERVRVVPNHACAVTNLQDVVYGVSGRLVKAHWPVAARGCTV